MITPFHRNKWHYIFHGIEGIPSEIYHSIFGVDANNPFLIPAIELLSDNEKFCQDFVIFFMDNNGEQGKVRILLPVLASLACCSSNTCLPSVILSGSTMLFALLPSWYGYQILPEKYTPI